ncbi:MAG: pantoate kinase [Candidatus Kariarchaeaceae archaeon]
MTYTSPSFWVPGHVTGFFTINWSEKPLEAGSTGAGFSIAEGVTTSLSLSDDVNEKEIEITWNGQLISGEVTKKVISLMEVDHSLVTGRIIAVNHSSKLPMGCGLSTSSAGALGTAMIIWKITDPLNEEKLDFETLWKHQASKTAHISEVILGTGLGGVISQLISGLEIRKKPGGPGIAEIVSFQTSERVLIASLGKISTAEVIRADNWKQIITKNGKKVLKELLTDQRLETFQRLAYTFAQQCEIITPKVKEMIKLVLETDPNAKVSMAMLGETIFCFSETLGLIEEKLKAAYGEEIVILKTEITSKIPYFTH